MFFFSGCLCILLAGEDVDSRTAPIRIKANGIRGQRHALWEEVVLPRLREKIKKPLQWPIKTFSVSKAEWGLLKKADVFFVWGWWILYACVCMQQWDFNAVEPSICFLALHWSCACTISFLAIHSPASFPTHSHPPFPHSSTAALAGLTDWLWTVSGMFCRGSDGSFLFWAAFFCDSNHTISCFTARGKDVKNNVYSYKGFHVNTKWFDAFKSCFFDKKYCLLTPLNRSGNCPNKHKKVKSSFNVVLKPNLMVT